MNGPGDPHGDQHGDQHWWEPHVPNDRQRARLRAQIDLIKAGLENEPSNRRRDIEIVVSSSGDDAEFLYRADTILVRDANAEAAYAVLGMPYTPDKRHERLAPPIRGLRAIVLTDRWTADSAVGEVNDALGASVASHDRVLHVCPTGAACPATEPHVADAKGPDPKVNTANDGNLGRGVSVAVIDTDYLPEVVAQHDWLHGVTGDHSEFAANGHYRGHGTFVAGVVRTQAPAADVHVHPWLLTSGGQIESDLAPLLVQALSRHPDIMSLSAGTTLGPGEPPESVLSLAVFQQEYLACSNTLLVCAAGNDGGAGPFLPASAGWPIAVGALNADKTLAGYSNRGPWVDVYARGTDVVNAYPNGAYSYHEPPMKGRPDAHFTNGLASWSGTSFSTPLVSGLIAARMSWSGEKAPAAAAALMHIAQQNAHNGMWVLEPGDADAP